MPFQESPKELIAIVVNGLRNNSLTPIEPGATVAAGTSIPLSQELINKAYKLNIDTRQLIDISNGMESKLYRIGREREGRKVWVRSAKAKNFQNDSQDHINKLKLNYVRLFCAYIIGAVNTTGMYGCSENKEFLNTADLIQSKITDAVHIYVKKSGMELTKIASRKNAKNEKAIEKELEAHAEKSEKELTKILEQGKKDLVNALIKVLKENPKSLEAFKSDIIYGTNHSDSRIAAASEEEMNTLIRSSLITLLDANKDWAGIEDETYTVITVTDMEKTTNEPVIDDTRLVVMDEPLIDLTAKQRDELSHLSDQKWFKELPPTKQRTLAHFIPKILAGKCGVPSQLRGIAPLTRNFYRQVPAVVSYSGKEIVIDELSHNLHSGTDAYLNRDVLPESNIHLTENNFEQIKHNAATDAVLIVNLNSKAADPILGFRAKLMREFYRGDDTPILQMSEKAAANLRDKNIFVAKYCLNEFRLIPLIESSERSGIWDIFGIINENTKKLGATYKNQINEINKAQRDFLKLTAKEKFSLLDPEVVGIELIIVLTEICFLNNKLIEQARADGLDPEKNSLLTTSIKFNCASGDNRTGFTEYVAIIEKMVRHFNAKGKSLGTKHRHMIAMVLAKSEHIQSLKGYQLATWGTEFFRRKSKGSLPKKYQEESQFLMATYGDMKSIKDVSNNAHQDASLPESDEPTFSDAVAERRRVEADWEEARNSSSRPNGSAAPYVVPEADLEDDVEEEDDDMPDLEVVDVPEVDDMPELAVVEQPYNNDNTDSNINAARSISAHAAELENGNQAQHSASAVLQATSSQSQAQPGRGMPSGAPLPSQAEVNAAPLQPTHLVINKPSSPSDEEEVSKAFPWFSEETTATEIESLAELSERNKALPLSSREHIHDLRAELCKQLSRHPDNENNRYKICQVVAETKKMLSIYDVNVAFINDNRVNFSIKKTIVADFSKDANHYEKKVIELSPSKKTVRIGCAIVGGILGALIGGLAFGSIGLMTGAHVGLSVGALWGAVKGINVGILVGSACATFLTSYCFAKIGNSAIRTTLFSPQQNAAVAFEKSLKESLVYELQQNKFREQVSQNAAPWIELAKARKEVESMLVDDLPLEIKESVISLQAELSNKLNQTEALSEEKIRYKVCKVAAETKKMIASYKVAKAHIHDKEVNISTKKKLVADFAKDAALYEKKVLTLSPSKKSVQLGCSIVGGLLGALIGGVVFGAMGFMAGAHVGFSAGALWGAVKGANVGVLVGGACATFLATHVFAKIGHSVVRTSLFSPQQNAAYKLKNKLDKALSLQFEDQKQSNRRQ